MKSKGKKKRYISDDLKERVLDVIKDHVGRPCPTNMEIVEMVDVTRSHVQSTLAALVTGGVLSRSGRYKSRSYTIVETGESTLPTKHKVCDQPAQYATRNISFRSAPMGDGVAYRDLDPDELDDEARAYLDFDSSIMWPRHWPSRPIARKEGHRSPSLVARLRSSSSHAS